MNHTKRNWSDPLSEFQQAMDAAAEKLRNQLEDLEPYCGSQALKFAVRAGLQPQMAYTVSESPGIRGSRQALFMRRTRLADFHSRRSAAEMRS